MKINEIEPPKVSDKYKQIASNHGLLMDPELARTMAFMETVKLDSQPYLKEIDYNLRGNQLYRGVINTTKPFIAKTVRLKNRNPKDTSLDLHNKINGYFQEIYGAPFRNSIHVTSDLDQASEYASNTIKTGNVYIIFPVGQFDFLWSPAVSDMLDSTMSEPWPELVDKTLSTYQTTDLIAAIRSGHEIMIRSKEYYGLKYSGDITYKHWEAFEELVRT